MQGFEYSGGQPQVPRANKPSGCSTIVLLFGILLLCAGGGALFWLGNRENQQLFGGASGFSGEMDPDDWNGSKTLECTGNDNVTLSGKTIAATASPAIRATGACTLTLVGST